MDLQNGQAVPAKRRSYNDEFKQDAVRLVAAEGYSFKTASEAVGICEQTLRTWHAKLVPQPDPCGADASMRELQAEVKRLRKTLKQAEMEREILKKATAYFAKEST
jgi:transposase